MTKKEMEEIILSTKKEMKLTWAKIGEVVGLDPVCVAAACMGSASLLPDEAKSLAELMELSEEVEVALTEFPMKGVGQVIPSDPLIYRFFEIAYVYGPSVKDVVHEMFGDGIMSAIDFSLKVDKVEDPKGDRVKVTMEGKFLPYKKW